MDYVVKFNDKQRLTALKHIMSKITRILYVYERSLADANYHYRSYVYSVIMYISSCNTILDDYLVDVIINLNNLLINDDLSKKEIRKIVLDARKMIEVLIEK